MIKPILALTAVAVLSACSSSSSDTDDTNVPDNSEDNTVTDNVDLTPPGGGDAPADGTKAGAYIGDFGSGNGVYIIDNENNLSGLALSAEGSAQSLFGNIGDGSTFAGTLNSYTHPDSVLAEDGIFGAGDPSDPATITVDLNIVDGQTIESQNDTSVRLVGASAGALSSANSTTLSGTWTGGHRFCGADVTACDTLVTEITFNGTAVEGSTRIVGADGSEGDPLPIVGSITDFGDVSLLTFSWLSNVYNGSVFFATGSTTELVFIGETDADVERKTIASLLTQ